MALPSRATTCPPAPSSVWRFCSGPGAWPVAVTVPGKGYRFIGQVRVQPEIGPPALEGEAAPGGALAAATARFWVESGLAGEARSWLAGALEVAPTAAQADILARLQRSLAALSVERGSRV